MRPACSIPVGAVPRPKQSRDRVRHDEQRNVAVAKAGKRDTSITHVRVGDVLDQTAVAQVTASWGIDHMLLAKYDGKWQIVQIPWQSPLPKS
jgi:Putative lumazine-binding